MRTNNKQPLFNYYSKTTSETSVKKGMDQIDFNSIYRFSSRPVTPHSIAGYSFLPSDEKTVVLKKTCNYCGNNSHIFKDADGNSIGIF